MPVGTTIIFSSQKWKCNKQPYDVTQKCYKGLTQWAFVLLGTTIKQISINKHDNVRNKFMM